MFRRCGHAARVCGGASPEPQRPCEAVRVHLWPLRSRVRTECGRGKGGIRRCATLPRALLVGWVRRVAGEAACFRQNPPFCVLDLPGGTRVQLMASCACSTATPAHVAKARVEQTTRRRGSRGALHRVRQRAATMLIRCGWHAASHARDQSRLCASPAFLRPPAAESVLYTTTSEGAPIIH